MRPSSDPSRRTVLAAGASLAATCLPSSARAARGGAPGFVGIESWINSGPLSMQGLRGRVVLVNFWARQCINCRRALPYIKGWYASYADRGFTVVGVHTPEFEVEKSVPALEAAVASLGILYPVAQDTRSATWNAWGNQYWPAEYLVDQRGRIVHSHFGEGSYGETEELIRGLLG